MTKISIKIVRNCKFFTDFSKNFGKLLRRSRGSAHPHAVTPFTGPPLLNLDPPKKFLRALLIMHQNSKKNLDRIHNSTKIIFHRSLNILGKNFSRLILPLKIYEFCRMVVNTGSLMKKSLCILDYFGIIFRIQDTHFTGHSKKHQF